MNAFLHSLSHDGPVPLPVRGYIPPRRLNSQLSTLNIWECGGGGSKTTQSQTTATTDSRVGVSGDGNTTLKDISVGGGLSIVSADAGVANNAIDTAVDLTRIGADTTTAIAREAMNALDRLVSSNEAVASKALGGAGDIAARGLSTASEALSEASARAAQVADSQAKFLSVQTGQATVQKTILYGVVGASVIGIGLALANRK